MITARFSLPRNGITVNVDFTAAAGLTAIFGPSGSGKTSVLNAIAGLSQPASGTITIAGETLFDSAQHINVPVHRRGIGYVFQDSLLFPHLSVEGNLLYGAGRKPANFAAITETLGLTALLQRRPATLSGGERQRVALGRAVFAKPRLLLMDEPLAALDTARKQEILPLIESLRDLLRLPILYVSHAVDEVARLADSVVVMDQGRMVQQGPPESVLTLPPAHTRSRFDRVSVLTATARHYDPTFAITTLDHPAGPITIAGHLPTGQSLRLPIHATDVTLALAPPTHLSIRTALHGTIDAIEPGDQATSIVSVTLTGGQTLAAAATRKAIAAMNLNKGGEIWCLIKAVAVDERWFRHITEERP